MTDTDQQSVLSYFIDGSKLPSTFTVEEFRKKLVKFVVATNQAFTIVESQEFKDLISYAGVQNKKLIINGADTLRNDIQTTFKEKKEMLAGRLKLLSSNVSFTIDCWTSANQHPFQGVTAHWIDDNWKIQSTVLDLALLEGPHTGKNLCGAFINTLKTYDIERKVLGISTDNASNMDSFFMEFQIYAEGQNLNFTTTDNRVRCLAHILNLSCQAILQSAYPAAYEEDLDQAASDDELPATQEQTEASLISKLRRGIMKIRSSPQRRQLFNAQCDAGGITPKALIRDVRDRKSVV